MARIGDGGDLLKCSFCGKSQKQVKKLIAGPGVYICDECIDLCNEIIEEELAETSELKWDELPKPMRDLRVPRRLRRRPGRRQEGARGRGLQPLQAGPGRRVRQARPATTHVELAKSNILLLGPDRLRQDAPRADAGPDAQRPVRHRRRHRAHRGRLRRRGRREHPAQADPGRRLRRQEGRDRHHLHRRDRQDRPQEREPVDHPRRLRRGRAAGAAEDPRGHHRLGAAAGRPQAPAPGVHPDRHHQRAVHRAAARSPAWRRSSRPASARRASASAPTLHSKADRDDRRRLRRRACPRTC